MSNAAPQRQQSSSQPESQSLLPPIAAPQAGLAQLTSHFGLLDVPPPRLYNAGARRGSISNEPPRSGICQLAPADGSLEVPLQHSLSEELRSGSKRSRDAALPFSSAERSVRTVSGQEKPDSFTETHPPTRPIRPKAITLQKSGESRGKNPSPSQRNAVVPMGGVEASRLEGSATSDENMQPRLVPKQGAGPELRREGGGRIDEYLMRLLRNGSTRQQDAAEPFQAGASTGANAASNAAALQWQGSRLGPLAPGAGIKASSIQPSRLAQQSALPSPQPPGWQPSDQPRQTSATEDPVVELSRLARPSNASQPSTAGGETSQEPAQKSQSAQFGFRGGELAPPNTDTSSSRRPSDISQTAKAALGEAIWQQTRATMIEQSDELQRQVQELHRLAAEQQRLQMQAAARGQLPPASALASNAAANQIASPRASGNPAWWLNQMPWATMNPGPSRSWQKFDAAGPEASMAKAAAPPPRPLQVSRTTQIALDAQKMRRNSRAKPPLRPGDPTQAGPSQPIPSLAAPGGVDAAQANWFSAMSSYLQSPAAQPQRAAQPAANGGRPGMPFDPLTAWYQYHFGQTAGAGRSAQPPTQSTSALYGFQLAGLPSGVPDRGWENDCNQYFNFSMPGTSENKTGNTGLTSIRQPSRLPHNQAMSAPPQGLHGSHGLRQQVGRADGSADLQTMNRTSERAE